MKNVRQEAIEELVAFCVAHEYDDRTVAMSEKLEPHLIKKGFNPRTRSFIKKDIITLLAERRKLEARERNNL